MSELNTYTYPHEFVLESGECLSELELAYHTYGELNADKSNVIWVCHALTANSDVLEWWDGIFGENKLFNPKEHYIVCANILGSHYGSTSPLSTNPQTGEAYYLEFPQFTIRDMVQAHELLRKHLELTKIYCLMGSSVGGQQAIEWGISNPKLIENLILIATNSKFSSWGIAFNETQRMAIENAPDWKIKSPESGVEGLKTARAIALLSYRNYNSYEITQKNIDFNRTDQFRASSYQRYQGDKLAYRFNAYSYWYLTKAMDSHNVGRNRGTVEKALSKITARTLIVAVDTDIMFPMIEQEYMNIHIKDSQLKILHSAFGHDGFLIDTEQLSQLITTFLNHDNKEV